MIRVPPRRSHYRGKLLFKQPKIDNWIRRHGSFASRDWLRNEIRYRMHLWGCNRSNHCLVYPTVFEGKNRLTVRIEFIYHPNGTAQSPFNHVYVYHAHVLRKKSK